jgi:hypothetical protein
LMLKIKKYYFNIFFKKLFLKNIKHHIIKHIFYRKENTHNDKS